MNSIDGCIDEVSSFITYKLGVSSNSFNLPVFTISVILFIIPSPIFGKSFNPSNLMFSGPEIET